MTGKETAMLSRTVPDANGISTRWSVGPLGPLALVWCLRAWWNCEVRKFFSDFIRLVEFFQEHEINKLSSQRHGQLHTALSCPVKSSWTLKEALSGANWLRREKFSPFQSPGIPLRPSTSWDTMAPRLYFWPAGLCHVFISNRFESFSPDELEIGGPATSICRSALLAVLWGQYTWIWQGCGFLIARRGKHLFFLRLAGFMGSLPRELPLAYFLYPKAKVAYGYVALYSQPNPSLGLAFLSQVPGGICKPGTAWAQWAVTIFPRFWKRTGYW